MKVHTLEREQLIRRPKAEVFEFFERPENLERITPASLGFHILTPEPITMKAAAILDYTIDVLGIPVRWTTVITDYDPPNGFTDVALRGPYSFWHHAHSFEEVEGGTMMKDEVHYVMPLGVAGRLVHRLWVKGQLRRIFDHRAKVIRNLVEGAC